VSEVFFDSGFDVLSCECVGVYDGEFEIEVYVVAGIGLDYLFTAHQNTE
jgi:hypothetical protein